MGQEETGEARRSRYTSQLHFFVHGKKDAGPEYSNDVYDSGRSLSVSE
jgi:hypothetical protein